MHKFHHSITLQNLSWSQLLDTWAVCSISLLWIWGTVLRNHYCAHLSLLQRFICKESNSSSVNTVLLEPLPAVTLIFSITRVLWLVQSCHALCEAQNVFWLNFGWVSFSLSHMETWTSLSEATCPSWNPIPILQPTVIHQNKPNIHPPKDQPSLHLCTASSKLFGLSLHFPKAEFLPGRLLKSAIKPKGRILFTAQGIQNF